MLNFILIPFTLRVMQQIYKLYLKNWDSLHETSQAW